MTGPKAVTVDWEPGFRLVPSQFPPRTLLDRLGAPGDLDVLYALQAHTNPRLRQELGEISLVPPEDRVVGPGSSPIMAAFCHLNPEGSRFSDGSYGVYYAASSLEAALAEVSHHRTIFMRRTQEPAAELDMRAYTSRLEHPLHDVRGPRWKALHDPQDYVAPRRFAAPLRAAGSHGLVYRSVRKPGAQCIAVFRPRAIRVPVVQAAHVALLWDGQAIRSWYVKSDLQQV